MSNGRHVTRYAIKVDAKISKKYNYRVFFKNLGLLNVLLFLFLSGELSLNVIRDNGELANCVLVRLVPIASLDRATDLFVFNYDSICNFEEPNRGSCLLKILLQGLLFKFNGKEVRKKKNTVRAALTNKKVLPWQTHP